MCVQGIRLILEGRLSMVIYTGHSFLSPAKFMRCILSDMQIKETNEYCILRVAITSITTLLSWSICAYLCLPPTVRGVDFCIEAFLSSIAVKVMIRGVYEMLGVCRLPHQPSNAFDAVSTPVFVSSWVIVIASDILESV